MKLGFSKLIRKLSKSDLRSIPINGSLYYMDENDRIVARLKGENILTLFVTGKDGSRKTLNLVYNFKYKCDQDVIIADVAFTSDENGNSLPIVIKNRNINFEADDNVNLYGTASFGTVDVSNEYLKVSIPSFNLDGTCEDVIIKHDASPLVLFRLTTRAIHSK